MNTATGNKQTTIPIVGWKVGGGLPVSLVLYHNSQSTRNFELGQKWSNSFDNTLAVDGSGNVTVTWGDGTSYTFTKSGSAYTPPTGIHANLTSAGIPIVQYSIVMPSQVKYNFAVVGGTWVNTATDWGTGTQLPGTRRQGLSPRCRTARCERSPSCWTDRIGCRR